MNRRSLALFLLLCPMLSFANITEISLRDGDRLTLIGLDAQVNLNFVPGAKVLKLNGDLEGRSAGRYTFERKEHELVIRMNEYNNKKEWRDALIEPNTKAPIIEITGAAVPAEIQLRTGKVTVVSWNKELKINLGSGKFTAESVSGAINLHQQKGDVVLIDQSGKLVLDTYAANVQIKKLNADADLNLYSGQLNIEKSHGFVSLNTHLASTKMIKCDGVVRFDIGKGSLTTQAFQGRIDGQLSEGSVSLALESESETNIKSGSGRVSVSLPPQSGAFLNLLTSEGDIYVPSDLRVNRLATEKSVRGRLHGESQKISVVVRSLDGNINIK